MNSFVKRIKIWLLFGFMLLMPFAAFAQGESIPLFTDLLSAEDFIMKGFDAKKASIDFYYENGADFDWWNTNGSQFVNGLLEDIFRNTPEGPYLQNRLSSIQTKISLSLSGKLISVFPEYRSIPEEELNAPIFTQTADAAALIRQGIEAEDENIRFTFRTDQNMDWWNANWQQFVDDLLEAAYLSAEPYEHLRDSISSITKEISIRTGEVFITIRPSYRTRSAASENRPLFVNEADAAAYIRNGLKERKPLIEFYFDNGQSFDWWSENYAAFEDRLYEMARAHTGVPNEGDYLLNTMRSSEQKVSIEYGGPLFTFEPVYRSTAAQEEETARAIASVLDSLALSGKTDVEKAKAIYTWIVTNVAYDEEHVNDPNYDIMRTAYGCIIHGKCVCQGFAGLYYRMLLETGIDTRILTGCDHAWNIVRIGNQYYNADTTFETGVETGDNRIIYRYFLKGTSTFEDEHHLRDFEFSTDAFRTAYPVSYTDYQAQ